MSIVTVTLPDPLREFVNAKVSAGDYASAGAYLEALVEEKRRQEATERLETFIHEGLESGKPVEANAEFWAERERILRAKHPEAFQG